MSRYHPTSRATTASSLPSSPRLWATTEAASGAASSVAQLGGTIVGRIGDRR